MSKLVLQYSIINDTAADAVPVEANFNRIEGHINQEVIERGGSVAMTSQLKLAGNPVAADDAVAKGYVDLLFPVASILGYGGTLDPAGGIWVLADGRELDSASYPDLFAVIGTSYGSASGGRFNIPDLRDRVPLGAGSATPIGSSGGSRNAVVPTHAHTIDHTHAGGTTGNTDLTHAHGGTTQGTDRASGAVHHHQLPNITVIQVTAAPTFYTSVSGGGGFDIASTQFDLANLNTYDTNTDHLHGFNTANALGNHGHTFQTPAHGGSSGNTGVSATDANLPPYRAVNYIVKVR